MIHAIFAALLVAIPSLALTAYALYTRRRLIRKRRSKVDRIGTALRKRKL